ncbi:tRNA 2-thiouridine(34) synthase MnmA [soil metagenome]
MKIAVLVSGGVDSSVALALLKEQGHDLTAFYLKIWLEDELSYLGQCPWEEDLAYVRSACEQLEVPLEVVSLQKEYWDQVVAYTMAEIKSGRTPNPDVLCNQRIKFGMFFNHIDSSLCLSGSCDSATLRLSSGVSASSVHPEEQLSCVSKDAGQVPFDKVATGHYAQSIADDQGVYHLMRAPDQIKDQTYFLSYLSQKQLARALFPIGHLPKEKVRELARSFNLPNKDRKDSQGICFLGKLKFNDFIASHVGQQPGDLVEYETGKVLGTHKGFWFHTIGQRQGSGLAGGPWYVVAKDVATNKVFISRNYYSPDKQRNTFIVSDCNWLTGIAPTKTDLQVKIRHGKHIYDCVVVQLDETRWQVTLAQDDQGIAPGQFAVFYDDLECLGAGIIAQ